MPCGLRSATRAKSAYAEADERGTFWRGITLDVDTRLLLARAIAKTEEQVAHQLMAQLKDRGHREQPPAMATDGKRDYRVALVDRCGQVPAYQGRGRPPTIKQPQPDWQYVQVLKERCGNRVTGVHSRVV